MRKMDRATSSLYISSCEIKARPIPGNEKFSLAHRFKTKFDETLNLWPKKTKFCEKLIESTEITISDEWKSTKSKQNKSNERKRYRVDSLKIIFSRSRHLKHKSFIS
jgi:hypothetical protein